MSKSARWAWLVALVALTGGALVLVFLLALSSGGPLAQRHFAWLFWANTAVAALLLLTVLIAAVRLVVRLRRGRFGSRLLAKLAAIFAIVGLVPGLLIYAVSYQFVERSIDAWFDQQVAGALEAGLALGRGGLDAMAADLAGKARNAAERLPDSRNAIGPLALERARDGSGVRDAALVSGSGQVLAQASTDAAATLLERPAPAFLRQARSQRVASQVEGLDDEPTAGTRPAARVRALALVPSSDITLGQQEERYLMLVQEVPAPLLANALAVQAAYREYQQRAITVNGLRRMYIGTLTLALVLAVFGAVLLAVMLGHQIARPLLLLADGVQQVADGDLTPKPVFASRDELGGLTRAFARMTGQLSEARSQVQAGVDRLEAARRQLQTILDSQSAGVVVFDAQRRITHVNPGATRILRQPLAAFLGRTLHEVPGLHDLAEAVWRHSLAHRAGPEAGEDNHWQDAFDYSTGPQDTLNLILRGAPLPDDAQLLVFDDISEEVSAQRAKAWAEVARRLAHEIKNPLTPIQLSAERLQHKLAAKLSADDAALLERSVATIVAQVQGMKRLVDEFRDYARLPAAQLMPLDLNALVAEVLALYGQAQDSRRLLSVPDPRLPLIEGDATQLRQVVHNLVQNALDAVADRPDGQVRVATDYADRVPPAVRLTVSDNGPGFAEQVLKRAFEPYVTTKAKGTGLGLAVVRKIVLEHAARIRIGNRSGPGPEAAAAGAQVSISFSRLAAVHDDARGGNTTAHAAADTGPPPQPASAAEPRRA
ncbi:MAG: ATP-binding protein [Aquabacterium sp.]